MDLPTFHFWECPLEFWGNQDVNLKLASPQYSAWSDCMDVLIWVYNSGKGQPLFFRSSSMTGVKIIL